MKTTFSPVIRFCSFWLLLLLLGCTLPAQTPPAAPAAPATSLAPTAPLAPPESPPAAAPLPTAARTAASQPPATPAAAASTAPAAAALPTPAGSPLRGYDIGSPQWQDLYVSPSGSDSAAGDSPARPLRTLSAAWAGLPAELKNAVRINLLPGTYPCEPGPEASNCINYFADRKGSLSAPLLVRAANGPNTVTLRGGLNFNNVQYLYLLDLNLVGGGPLPTNSSGNNLLHIEAGDHILLRGLSVVGPACVTDDCNNLQEVLKVNQTQYLYVENSLIAGAWHSVVDYFVVQYGHFLNNRVHSAGQWCMYIKGGSAYLTVEANELYQCQLGFQSGQAANLAVMRPPWFHYETYNIRFINNLLHDIPGVGLSAAGAYNTLFAYNTLYKVATSAEDGYAFAQLVPGERNCTPIDEIPNVIRNCAAFTAQGAWGPAALAEGQPAIPNRKVYFYNNLFYNPAPAQTRYAHFEISGPLTLPSGFKNLPNPVVSDREVFFAGNLVWNGSAGFPLGVEEPERGCQPSNPTCNPSLLAKQNTFNQLEPQLVNPAAGDFRPRPVGSLAAVKSPTIPDFTWDAFTPAVPPGSLSNAISLDRAGAPRPAGGPPGAYAAQP